MMVRWADLTLADCMLQCAISLSAWVLALFLYSLELVCVDNKRRYLCQTQFFPCVCLFLQTIILFLIDTFNFVRHMFNAIQYNFVLFWLWSKACWRQAHETAIKGKALLLLWIVNFPVMPLSDLKGTSVAARTVLEQSIYNPLFLQHSYGL